MTRKGFLGALLGVPFVAGWVTKLDKRGEPTLAAIEPVSVMTAQEDYANNPSAMYVRTTATGGYSVNFYSGGHPSPTYTQGAS